MPDCARSRRASVPVLVATAFLLVVPGFALAASAGAAPGRTVYARGVDTRTVAAHRLVALVPRAFRSTCIVGDAPKGDAAPGQVASVACRPGHGVGGVIYVQYRSAADAESALDALVDTTSLDRESSDAADCPSSSTYSQSGKATAGRVYCFLALEDNEAGLAAGTPVETWTYRPRALLVQASAADVTSLHRFWRRDAGPLSAPDRRGIPPLATTASLRHAGNALRSRIPKASRGSCLVRDSETSTTLGSIYAYRLWLVADVEECHPTHGAQSAEYVQFSSTTAMNRYFDDKHAPDDPGRDRRVDVQGIRCSGLAPYDAGRAKPAGRVACDFGNYDAQGRSSDTEYAVIAWTSKPTRVVGAGIAPSSSTRALVKWWIDDAGPKF
jgi:hypothetical protein